MGGTPLKMLGFWEQNLVSDRTFAVVVGEYAATQTAQGGVSEIDRRQTRILPKYRRIDPIRDDQIAGEPARTLEYTGQAPFGPVHVQTTTVEHRGRTFLVSLTSRPPQNFPADRLDLRDLLASWTWTD